MIIQVQQNYPLKKYNTFGVETYARYFSTFSSIEELENSLTLTHKLQTTNYKLFILGCGSNILFTKNYEGLILKNEIKGVNT
ncbi:MAG: UDP-N-acetylmuramate dehydrogenase, partial [Chitinophagaceae bacterium]